MPVLTYTDRLIMPPYDGGEAPGLLDIAVALSRMPRFAGHGRRWWSVLDHHLFGHELTLAGTNHHDFMAKPMQWSRKGQLAWLLHDAHEALTGDVPTGIKGDDLRRTQEQLDHVIYDTYYPGGWRAAQVYRPGVKKVDRVCLIAEARVIGPAVSQRRLEDVEPLFRAPGEPDVDGAEKRLYSLLKPAADGPGALGIPPRVDRQDEHPTVQAYLNRVVRLL